MEHQKRKILLSGIQPSGRPHIGNYFAAMKPNVDFQESHDAYLMIADYHALTTTQGAVLLREQIIDLAIDYLAIGFDPEKAVLFQQSSVPEHTEAAWIFNCITTMPYLMRAHAFKDAEQKHKEVTVGLFDYPMLMAADILLYDADVVPVGSDQAQHVEFARDTAEKFNHVFGETFKLPAAYIREGVGTIPGIDGRKMSKSYKNTIPLFAEDEEIERIVMSIVTDSKGVGEAKDPEQDITFRIYALLASEEKQYALAQRYRAGGIGYKEAKEILVEELKTFISPLREKWREVAGNRERVLKILKEGGDRARARAGAKMQEVRRKVGVAIS